MKDNPSVPTFKGTNVPIKTLFDFIEAGKSLEEFLSAYPQVKEPQVTQALKIAEDLLRRQNDELQ